MFYYRCALLLFFIFASLSMMGQEYVVPLINNPQLQNRPAASPSFKSDPIDTSMLTLPFFDDFSYAGPYPDQSRWTDKHVFVNHTLAENPPTIGIASFDCLDKNGQFHPQAGTVTFRSDSLTSKKIDLGRLIQSKAPGDKLRFCDSQTPVSDSLLYEDEEGLMLPVSTAGYLFDTTQTLYRKGNLTVFNDPLCVYDQRGDSIHPFPPYNHYSISASDSIILSFFYQPQGLGDGVDPEDSLLIELFDPLNAEWNQVHRIPGLSEVKWHYFAIPITESKYFNPGFQFRIVNKARISSEQDILGKIGSFDHWHVDYIYLDQSREQNIKTINDAAFSSNPGTIIRTLRSLPWSHFRNTTAYNTLRQNNFPFALRNLSEHTMWFYNISIETSLYPQGTKLHEDILGDLELNHPDTLIQINEDYTYLLDYPPSTDSVTLLVKAFFNPSFDNTENKDINPGNDTISFKQKFHNYYAYDDGSAENGYGVISADKNTTRIANRYQIYRSDTLRGIDILFNASFYEDIIDASAIKIAVWNHNNGPGSLFYVMEYDASGHTLHPGKRGSNEFMRYTFPEGVYLPAGTYYFGIIQYDGHYLNIGLDKNTDQSNHIFFFVENKWNQTQESGSLMIRPLFGAPLPVNSPQIKEDESTIRVYPNPAQDYVNITMSLETHETATYSINSLHGQLLMQGQLSNNTSIDIHQLPPGLYLVTIKKNNRVYTSKLIKNR